MGIRKADADRRHVSGAVADGDLRGAAEFRRPWFWIERFGERVRVADREIAGRCRLRRARHGPFRIDRPRPFPGERDRSEGGDGSILEIRITIPPDGVGEGGEHAFRHQVGCRGALRAAEVKGLEKVQELDGCRAEARNAVKAVEVERRLLEHLGAVGGKVVRRQDAAACLHFPFDQFRHPSLVEAGGSVRRDEAQRAREFGEIEGRRAAELAVDLRQFATGTEVTMGRRVTAHERVGLADVEQLVPGHDETGLGKADRGFENTGPVEVSPALVDFPQGGDGTRNACGEVALFGLEAFRPRRLVVLEAACVVDFEHVLAGLGRRPQVTVDRHQAAFSCGKAGKAGIAADAALGRLDDKTRESGGDDGIEGIASGLEKGQSGPDRVGVSGRHHAAGSAGLPAMLHHDDVPPSHPRC